ncbi:hypothetical protein [uncultured Nostoc sp.]|uniref:hypothetical protein n=1 Tax=uncultured Nostoc sp. TaxID=340711 RepID=UPI0035CB0338
MTTKLTPDELFDHAEQHRQVSQKLMTQRTNLQAKHQGFINTGASLEKINQIKENIQERNSKITQEILKAQELDTQGMRDILVETDLQNAKIEIDKATKKVLEAVENLDDIRKSLQFVDLFIRLGGAIVNATITGNPAAQIKAIVKAIDAL